MARQRKQQIHATCMMYVAYPFRLHESDSFSFLTLFFSALSDDVNVCLMDSWIQKINLYSCTNFLGWDNTITKVVKGKILSNRFFFQQTFDNGNREINWKVQCYSKHCLLIYPYKF